MKLILDNHFTGVVAGCTPKCIEKIQVRRKPEVRLGSAHGSLGHIQRHEDTPCINFMFADWHGNGLFRRCYSFYWLSDYRT